MSIHESLHSAKVHHKETAVDYVIGANDNLGDKKKITILIDSSGSTSTLSFAAASSYLNSYFYIKDVAGSASVNNITLNLTGSDTFNGGGSSSVVSTDYAAITLFPSSGTWHSMSLSSFEENLGKYSDFPTLSASIVADTSSVAALYNRSNQTYTGLIGYFGADPTTGGVIPLGEVDFTKVTDSQWAQVEGSTPGLGPELNTANDASSPPSITEADSVGTWATAGTGDGGTLESLATTSPASGSYMIKLTTGTNNNNWRLFKAFTATISTDYKISFWAKGTNINTQRISIQGISPSVSINITNTEWKFFEFDSTTTSTNISVTFIAELGTDPDPTRSVEIDSFSIRLNNNSATTLAGQQTIPLITGHNIADQSFVTGTLWDIDGAQPLSIENPMYVTGNTGVMINGAPGGAAGSDIVHVEGTSEFGEMRSRLSGGVWAPGADTLCYWENGLKGEFDGTNFNHVRLYIAAFPRKTRPTYLSMISEVEIQTGWATANYYVGFGYTSTGFNGYFMSGIKNTAGTWYRAYGGQTSLVAHPTITTQDVAGSGISGSIGYFGLTTAPSDASDVTITATSDGPAWTDGDNYTNVALIAGSGVRQGQPEDFIFLARGMDAVLRKLKYTAI